jgi:hypothetical protein
MVRGGSQRSDVNLGVLRACISQRRTHRMATCAHPLTCCTLARRYTVRLRTRKVMRGSNGQRRLAALRCQFGRQLTGTAAWGRCTSCVHSSFQARHVSTLALTCLRERERRKPARASRACVRQRGDAAERLHEPGRQRDAPPPRSSGTGAGVERRQGAEDGHAATAARGWGRLRSAVT